MNGNPPEERQSPTPEHDAKTGSSGWSRVAAVSACVWMLLSLPFLFMSSRFLRALRYHPKVIAGDIWSMDFVMMAVVLIVTPLPFIAGIATIAFLSVRTARAGRIAAAALRLSLLGMVVLVFPAIAMAIEGERMGGDMGPLQMIFSVLIGIVLPALISIPSILGLIALWRLKRTIPERG